MRNTTTSEQFLFYEIVKHLFLRYPLPSVIYVPTNKRSRQLIMHMHYSSLLYTAAMKFIVIPTLGKCIIDDI